MQWTLYNRRRKDVWGSVRITCDMILTVVPATVRINIVVRAISGEKIEEWTGEPPYLCLRDLDIASASPFDDVLKQSRILTQDDRLWTDGEDLTVELTLVKTDDLSDEGDGDYDPLSEGYSSFEDSDPGGLGLASRWT